MRRTLFRREVFSGCGPLSLDRPARVGTPGMAEVAFPGAWRASGSVMLWDAMTDSRAEFRRRMPTGRTGYGRMDGADA